MPIEWRDCDEDDAPVLAAIGRETFVETFGHLYSAENLALFLENHSEDNWRRELGDPAFAVRLAMSGDAAAAYAKLGPPKLPFAVDASDAIELKQFYVRGPWHGLGLAPVMMDWVMAEARRRGAHALYLSVFVDNHRARRFYDRYGFEPLGRYDFMVGSHADEDIVMRCAL